MARPFAVFDIDGTLIRWQLYHALADELARRGQLDAGEFQKVREARMTWKRRAGSNSFDAYERALVKLFNRAITGIAIADLEAAGRVVLAEYQDQVYTYTRDLIHRLKADGYLLFAISGSQMEMVALLAAHYGFDDYGGTVYERQDGRFTGLSQPLRSQSKPVYLKELVAKHQAGWQGSVGVGDSESDIPMLEVVEQPIAFNPTQELFQHAQQKGWRIVLERKNMVYELEPQDDNYRLAA